MASGAVIESFLDKGRGPVAYVLVREGTLHKGISFCVASNTVVFVQCVTNWVRTCWKRVRPFRWKSSGLSGVPAAGDEVTVVRDEKKAREVALYRSG